MEHERFDQLSRMVANGLTRRRLMQLLTGGVGAAAIAMQGTQASDAFICRKTGVLCAKDAQCCSNNCDSDTHRCVGLDLQAPCEESSQCSQTPWSGVICESNGGGVCSTGSVCCLPEGALCPPESTCNCCGTFSCQENLNSTWTCQ